MDIRTRWIDGPRRRWLALLVLVCLALGVACSDDPTGPATPESSTGEVTGVVRAEASGQPVPGAVVAIGEASAVTGQDGRYQLTDLPVGRITIRVSAAGFQDSETSTSIPASPITRDFSLLRKDRFEFGDYALYAPAGAPIIGAVVVALGGPDTRGFVTGGTFGAPVPEAEAALVTFGGRLRSLAQQRGVAVLGTSLSAMDDVPSSDEALAEALREAAVVSGRPELAEAPILFYGMSGGGPEASGFTARNPDRVVGLFLKVPAAIDPDVSGVPGVPAYVVQAELDAFVDNAAIDESFAAIRQAGGLWAKVLEPGVPHHSFSTSQRTFTLNWMNEILWLRLPRSAAGLLRPMNASTGWLGDQASHDIAAWADYTRDPAAASWLPTESAAEQWQSLGAVRGPSGATIALDRDTVTVSVGRVVNVGVRVFDGSGAKVEGALVTFTANPADIALPVNGTDYCEWGSCVDAVISGVTPGLAKVTALYEGATDEIEVTVVPAVGSIAVTPVEATLGVGESIVVRGSLLDEGGSELPDQPSHLYWTAYPDEDEGSFCCNVYVQMSDVSGTNGWEQKVTGLVPGTIYLRPWFTGPVGPDPEARGVAVITIE